jgi:hypothetical protein
VCGKEKDVCTKFKLITGDPCRAIKKEGDYPVVISDQDLEVIIFQGSELKEALDVLKSGLLDDDNPLCEVNHYHGE